MFNRIDWYVRLTHEPTGISVETDSTCFRTQKEAYKSLVSRLKSRLYMINQMQIDENDLVIDFIPPNYLPNKAFKNVNPSH